MLTNATKQEIRDKLELVKKAMPGFRSRPGQRYMIAEIAKTLARCDGPDSKGASPTPGSKILCVNAGTGSGKSLGYSLPCLVLAKEKKKKLVISSSTVALQEQLTQRDLPMFFKAMNVEARVEIAKGRTRYVCSHRLVRASSDLGYAQLHYRDSVDDSPSAANVASILDSMIKRLNTNEWDGDRDTWREPVDDVLWNAITTDRHGCLGQNCPGYRSCAQVLARKRVKEADVIVANHSLVLADLAMEGKIIGKPEDCIYVFDEAHSLPLRAVSAFASSHNLGSGRRLMSKISDFAVALGQALDAALAPVAEELGDLSERLAENMTDSLGYFSSLAQLRPSEATPRPTIEFELSCIPEEFHAIGASVVERSKRIAELLVDAADALNEKLSATDSPKEQFEKLLADAGDLLNKDQEILGTWRLFLEEPALDQPPIAKWVEASKGKGKGQVEFKMAASPVLAGNYLQQALWERAAGVVLTSASLTSLGVFDDFLYRCGLQSYGNAITCVDIPSPFDYGSQGSLVIPKMRTTPKDYAGHTAEISEHITALVGQNTAEGSLVLFTSKRQMEEVAGNLPPALRARVLTQGSLSKAEIIRTHRSRIDAGKPSTIFGLTLFEEGVDLAGKYCTNVCICKLPFSVPDDPVLRTLSKWITQRGGDPFMEISVPDAARRLEQRIGRLIRTETDTGVVTVLDTRLSDTRFGKAILRGLPRFRLVVRGREITF